MIYQDGADIRVHFKNPPQNILVVKRINSPLVTAVAVEIARYLKLKLNDVTLYAEPYALSDFHANVCFLIQFIIFLGCKRHSYMG